MSFAIQGAAKIDEYASSYFFIFAAAGTMIFLQQISNLDIIPHAKNGLISSQVLFLKELTKLVTKDLL